MADIDKSPISITYLDGRTEQLALQRLSIRQIHAWAKLYAQKDTPALIALCLSKPIDWIDTLSDESYAELAKECVARNFQRALKLAEKDPVLSAMLAPVMFEMAKLIEQMESTGLQLTPLSIAPPPKASAAETSTESAITPSSDSPQSSEKNAA